MTETSPELDALATEATAAAGADVNESLAPFMVHIVGRRGEADLTVPPLLEWGIEWRHCIMTDDAYGWGQAVFGPDDFRKFVACSPTLGQVEPVLTQITEHVFGTPEKDSTEQGESSAS